MELVSKDSGASRRIYIVDAHHHLGVDVDGQSNRNPAAPGGTFDFCLRLGSHLLKVLSNEKVDLKFQPHGFLKELLESEEKWRETLNGTWVIDQTVVFPFNDEFKWKEGDEGKATYWRSNDNVYRWVSRAPYSLKLIGYSRMVPLEGEVAIRELHRSITQLGLRGVKLHPRSDGWSNEIDSEPVVNFLTEAAKLGVPVIFDTRGFNQVVDIASATTKARTKLAKIDKSLARQLKVIIAHIGFHLSYDELYTVLSHPNIYGEISGIHNAGIRKLFEEAPHRLKESLGLYRSWSEKIIFGTDFPYFDVHHAVQFISYTLSEDFPGTIEDAQRILGINILRLIPPKLRSLPQKAESVHVDKTDLPTAKRMLASKMAKLFSEGKLDISSFEVFLSLPPRVSVRDDCLLLVKGKRGNGDYFPFIILTMMGLGVIARLDFDTSSFKPLISRELGFDDFPPRRHLYNVLWPNTTEKNQLEIEKKICFLLKPLSGSEGEPEEKLNAS
ncbi:MAG: amidohydrolase family protein [Candidatus Jordarchaeales archaeon]|nr:amidohydrolase family protein [Candidatus Jordarchaeia archaeon]